MRVLQVLLHEGIGGMETFAHCLHGALTDLGDDVVTIPLDAADSSHTPIGRMRRLRSQYARHHPDIVLSHSALPNLYTRAALGGKTPVVNVLHSGMDDFNDRRLRWAERSLQRRTGAVISVSRRVADIYLRRFPDLSSRMHIIPNGALPPAPDYQRYQGDGTRLLFAGRLVAIKQLDVAIHAMSMLPSEVPWRLTVAGDGDPGYSQQCKDLVRALEIEHMVEFVGATPSIDPLLRQSDLLVHPSLYESQGLSILEAGLFGVPSIVSQAVHQDLDPNLTRVAFSTGDASDLARAICESRRRIAELNDRAAALAANLSEAYSMDVTAYHYRKVLEALQPNSYKTDFCTS